MEIKLLCWFHWKKLSCIFFNLVCLCCIVPVSIHYRLCLATVCMKALQNGKLVRFSKTTHCWCAFSWSICNQNGHSVRCIQSGRIRGCGGMGTLHQLRGIVAESARDRCTMERIVCKIVAESARDRCTMERIVFKIVAESARDRCTIERIVCKITELQQSWQQSSIFTLKTVSTKTARQQLHKSSTHSTAASAKPLIAANNAKRRQR